MNREVPDLKIENVAGEVSGEMAEDSIEEVADLKAESSIGETANPKAENPAGEVADQKVEDSIEDISDLKAENATGGAAEQKAEDSIEEIPELKVENLVVRYDTEDSIVHAVNDISFEVPKRVTMGLVGETGAGKTTTALAIMRLLPDPPAKMISGKIQFAGTDISTYNETRMDAARGQEISMVFQDPMSSLNPVMTVGDQIAEVIMLHQDKSKKEAAAGAKEMLRVVGISEDRASEYPHQFSGGMKQRVMIAIALACNPRILIADEPTTALDVTIQAQVLTVMKEIKAKYDTAMILITHDLGVVADICDTVAIMYAGRIIEYGTLAEIFDHFKHPYTEGLFGSLPNLDRRDEKLKPIKGIMPDPSDLPTGCHFHPRCKYAYERCKTVAPEKVYFSDTHYVECLRYDDGSDFSLQDGDRR